MKRIFALLTLALALLLPAVAASQQNTANAAASASPHLTACADHQQLANVNPEYVWRLRAYEHSDCAVAILDAALKTPGNVITLSREQAEQVRANVWAARDAAARIGR